MAVYDGFFDAEQTGENADGTPKYDRTYSAGDFTDYFAQIAGSGVSVLDGADSCKVTYSGGQASIAPGFLFIRGYWLRIRDEPYTVAVTGTGRTAIVAHLNTAQKTITLGAQDAADTYPDALCLAVVDPASGAVEDTRHNAAVCGVVEPSGVLGEKLAFAQDYIDNKIDARLGQVEADISAQRQAVDTRIAAMQATVDSIQPPPVGTVRFSASKDIGEGWLRCDGSFVNEAEYPELVAALGKLTPGQADFKKLFEGEIAGETSNLSYWNNTMWVFDTAARQLIGVDAAGKVQKVACTGIDGLYNVTAGVQLSVCDGGFVYLGKASGVQTSARNNRPILYEAVGLNAGTTSLSFSAVSSVSTGISSKFSLDSKIIPRVIVQSGTAWVANGFVSFQNLGDSSASSNYNSQKAVCIGWNAGKLSQDSEFSNNKGKEILLAALFEYDAYAYGAAMRGMRAKFAVNEKNGDGIQLFYSARGDDRSAKVDNTGFASFKTGAASIPNGLYDNTASEITYSPDKSAAESSGSALVLAKKMYDDILAGGKLIPDLCLPVSDRTSEILMGLGLSGRKLEVWHLSSSPAKNLDWYLSNVSLPSGAQLFEDSICYSPVWNLWFVFVGTGIAFCQTLADNNWGYLDTQSIIGKIGGNGSVYYDNAKKALILSGQNTAGKPVMYSLSFGEDFTYANDGAWLPMIASDGVPAFIKAKEG